MFTINLHQRRQDHPRSRGEYLLWFGVSGPPRGSSPLSRGIQGRAVGHVPRAGIIPALAGNTCGGISSWPAEPDHPRSRGEYPDGRTFELKFRGSSPLSRGIRGVSEYMMANMGIIPALAGNTGAASRDQAKAWDHPRSRGEYASGKISWGKPNGSSPLSRGIPVMAGLLSVWLGIIPALAGNTYPKRPQPARYWDHPRSRGEY